MGLYGTLWGYFGVIFWTCSEGIFGVLLGFFGPNLTFLAIFGKFGPVFEVLCLIWWYFGLYLGQFWPILWILGPIWWYLGLYLANSALFLGFWARFDGILGWGSGDSGDLGQFGPIFGVLGPIWMYLILYWAY